MFDRYSTIFHASPKKFCLEANPQQDIKFAAVVASSHPIETMIELNQ